MTEVICIFPAYVLLLGTTWLSGGRPLLDCVLAWTLLIVYAWLMLRAMQRVLPEHRPRWLLPALVGFTLYPGHLANTQWGWQVAVFLCLAGSAAALSMLSRATLGWRENAIALIGMLVATTSFSTGLAVVPVAFVLIIARPAISMPRRLSLAAPWAIFATIVAVRAPGDAQLPMPAVLDFGAYVLNYIGASISRFATDLAPWLAVFAIVTGSACAYVSRSNPKARFWLGCMAFALGAAALTALGRVAAFGPDHAFVSRYVSFSSVFWIGWLGIVALTLQALRSQTRQLLQGFVVLVLVLGAFNALHMAKRAREVAERSVQTAETIRSQYPAVDDAILQDIYFGRSEQARARLDALYEQRFAPFDAQ